MTKGKQANSTAERLYDGAEERWEARLKNSFGPRHNQSIVFGKLLALPFIAFFLMIVVVWGFVGIQIMKILPESAEPGLKAAVFIFLFVMGPFVTLVFFSYRRAKRNSNSQQSTSD